MENHGLVFISHGKRTLWARFCRFSAPGLSSGSGLPGWVLGGRPECTRETYNLSSILMVWCSGSDFWFWAARNIVSQTSRTLQTDLPAPGPLTFQPFGIARFRKSLNGWFSKKKNLHHFQMYQTCYTALLDCTISEIVKTTAYGFEARGTDNGMRIELRPKDSHHRLAKVLGGNKMAVK